MRVGVLPVRTAPVDRQRIGQLFPFGQPPGESGGQLPPPGFAQLLGKRELDLPVEAPVGPLVLVRRRPIRARVILGPLRHILVLFVFQFLPVPLVASFALDVLALGEGRLAPGAGADAHFKMINRHGYRPLFPIQTNAMFLVEKYV